MSLREGLVLVRLLLCFASFLFFGFFNWWDSDIFANSVQKLSIKEEGHELKRHTIHKVELQL